MLGTRNPGNMYSGLIDKYRDRLPVAADTRAVTLGEGATPLIELKNLPQAARRGVRVYAKLEGANPTGSFKDRGMTMAVTQALEEGARAIICASTGNTSASAAAYAARAGIACFVLIPEGKIALGKLSQAMMHGSVVIQIRGNFDDGMRLVQQVAARAPVAIVNSVNPYRIQGQKTVAFEVLEALGEAPDYHALPVGNAGNITAHWVGYSESAGLDTAALEPAEGMRPYGRRKLAARRPAMLGYQAAGAAPIVRGRPVENPDTVATAIRIGNPVSWRQAVAAARESGGWFAQCSDEEILRAQALLARSEGVFCEPASATALAGVLKDLEAGKIRDGALVVCTLTGHGLKDPDTAIASSAKPVTVQAELSAIEQVILPRLER
ncbi:MAG TPA: threonine synthase [Burkholderiales bacterium]|nr:threonine synthase [Burkholderiales bacterium]